MLENLSWAHIFVLLVAALFILGPERLPQSAAWLGRTIRQVKDFASGAGEQLRQELGPELEQWRGPIEEIRGPLRELRALDPRRAASSLIGDHDGRSRNGYSTTPGAPGDAATAGPAPGSAAGRSEAPPPRPLPVGEQPPIDSDAT